MTARSVNEHACEILRAHGINAYEQSGEIVVYAATTSAWTRVAAIPTDGTDKAAIATEVAHKVADLVAGPHSHD